MSAPRTAARLLAAQRSLRPHRRALHMTGPATYSSAMLTRQPERLSRPSTARPSPDDSRSFNTSRALKAVKDSSPLDFAFLPSPEALYAEPEPAALLSFSSSSTTADTPVMRPEILAADPGSIVVAPLADVHDNASVDIDFVRVADGLKAAVARRVVGEGSSSSPAAAAEEEAEGGSASAVGRIWAGFVDDVFGDRKKLA